MPYPIPPLGIVECVFKGLQDAQRTLTVVHYRFGGASPAPDGVVALNGLFFQLNQAGAQIDTYLAAMGNTFQLQAVTLQLISPARFVALTFTPTTGQGQITGGCAPANVSMCLVRRADAAGRRNRGVLHLPGVPLSGIAGSSLTNAQLVRLTNVAGSLTAQITTVAGDVWDPVLYHRSSPVAGPVVTSAAALPQTRTERRRTVGRGI